MKRTKYVLAGIAFSLFALPVAAATFFGGDLVTVSSPVNDDAYGAGEAVTVSSEILGDAYFAGGQVTVSSNIQQDLMLAGGKVFVQSDVNDDARVVAGDLVLSGNVSDDALLVGGTVTVPSGTTIGGDAVIMGGFVILDGEVAGDVLIRAGKVIINGSVAGSAEIKADELTVNGQFGAPSRISAYQMDLGPNAYFNGLEYWRAAGPLSFAPEQNAFPPQYNTALAFQKGKSYEVHAIALKLAFAWFFFSLLSAAVIIALFTWLYRRSMRKVGEIANKKPGKSFVYGFLYFLLTPIVVLLLILTVVGWPLAVALIVMYLLTILFAKAITSIVVVQWIAQQQKQSWKPFTVFLMSLVAYIILKILTFIPILGWLVILVVVSIAFGALFQFKAEIYKSLEKKK